jgi:hypothetical protein
VGGEHADQSEVLARHRLDYVILRQEGLPRRFLGIIRGAESFRSAKNQPRTTSTSAFSMSAISWRRGCFSRHSTPSAAQPQSQLHRYRNRYENINKYTCR